MRSGSGSVAHGQNSERARFVGLLSAVSLDCERNSSESHALRNRSIYCNMAVCVMALFIIWGFYFTFVTFPVPI